VLADRRTSQSLTQPLVKSHERGLVYAPNAQHDFHEALPEDEELARTLVTLDRYIAQEIPRFINRRKFSPARNAEGSHTIPSPAQMTPESQSPRILEQYRATIQDVIQNDSGRPPERLRATANDTVGENSGVRSGEAFES
jgi:hypothetical protein